MTLQEKIQKKGEGFGKLAPVFIEGAEFALENQWISVKDDLPCKHKELIIENRTITVITYHKTEVIMDNYMFYENGKWEWLMGNPCYWFPIPKLPKEQEIKL